LFQRGETVVIDIIVMDAETEEPVNVNGIDITIRNPNGSIAASGVMSNVSTGMYSYTYNTESDAPTGEYRARLNVSTPRGWIVHDVFFYIEP